MEVEIQVLHFERYVKRSDLKSPKWFVLENDISTHPDFFEISGNEFKAFIHIAAICSKVNNACVRMNVEHSAHSLRISTEEFLSCIEKLKGKRWDVRNLYGSVRNPEQSVRVDKIKLEETRREEKKVKESKNPSSEAEKLLNKKIWEAYLEAYRQRYRVDPIRNGTVNAQVSQLRKRVGEKAIELVEFYLKHNDGFYLSKTHSIGLCLRDCESLMTQMLRNRPITRTTVREFEKSQGYEELRNSFITNPIGGPQT